MMVLFRLALNNIKKYKRESFLVVMSISLTISLITVVSILMTTLFSTSVTQFAAQWPFNAEIVGVKDSTALLNEIGRENVVYFEEVNNSQELFVETEEALMGVVLFYREGEFPETEFVANTLVDGVSPKNMEEIVIPTSSDFKIGDTLTVESSQTSEKYEMKVVGKSTYGRYFTYDESVMSQTNGNGSEVSIIFKDGTKNIKAILEDEVSSNVYNQDFYIRYNDDYNFLKGMGNNPGESLYFFIVFGVILISVVSLMTFSLILNSFDTSLSQKNQTLSVLKTVGATRRQMRLMILIEMLFLTVIALVLGLLIGTALSHFVIEFLGEVVQKIDTLSFGVASPKINILKPTFIYIVIVFVSVILVIIALSIKTRELFKSNVLSGQSNVSIKTEKMYKLKKNTIYSLAKINTKRSKSYRGIKVALFVSTATLIIVTTLVQTIMAAPRNMVESYETTIQGYFSSSANVEKETQGIKDIVESYKNVNDYFMVYAAGNVFLDDEKHEALEEGDYDLNFSGGTHIYVVEDKSFDEVSKLQGFEETINTFYVNKIDLYSRDDYHFGETVGIKISDGDLLNILIQSGPNNYLSQGIKVDRVVANNIEPIEKGSLLYVRESYYRSNIEKEIPIEEVRFKLDTDLEEDEVVELTNSINNFADDNRFYLYGSQGNKYIVSIIEDAIQVMGSFIFLYIGFVILINIVNITLSNYRNRKKEVATLKSIGASKKQVLKMFLFETMNVVFKPWLFAVLVANGISYLFYLWYKRVVSSVVVPKFVIELLPIGISIGLVALILLVVMASVLIESRKSNIIDDIKSY